MGYWHSSTLFEIKTEGHSLYTENLHLKNSIQILIVEQLNQALNNLAQLNLYIIYS